MRVLTYVYWGAVYFLLNVPVTLLPSRIIDDQKYIKFKLKETIKICLSCDLLISCLRGESGGISIDFGGLDRFCVLNPLLVKSKFGFYAILREARFLGILEHSRYHEIPK